MSANDIRKMAYLIEQRNVLMMVCVCVFLFEYEGTGTGTGLKIKIKILLRQRRIRSVFGILDIGNCFDFPH